MLAIIIIVMILTGIIDVLLIIGGNINKSKEEREYEDKEQMNYFK